MKQNKKLLAEKKKKEKTSEEKEKRKLFQGKIVYHRQTTHRKANEKHCIRRIEKL